MVHGWFLKSVDSYLRTFNISLLTVDLFKGQSGGSTLLRKIGLSKW